MTPKDRKELFEAAIVAFLVATFMAILFGLGWLWRDQACMTTEKIAVYMRDE